MTPEASSAGEQSLLARLGRTQLADVIVEAEADLTARRQTVHPCELRRPANLRQDGFVTHTGGVYDERLRLKTKVHLTAYFAPHNRRLCEFLGTDYGWTS